MTGKFEGLRSRVEIDARARAARLALERDAVALGSVRRRPRPLQQAMAELWRLVAGPWPHSRGYPLPGAIDEPRSVHGPASGERSS
jgi:hypothetical protein